MGYFEGLDSQRAIAWQCGDRRSLHEFLGLGPTERSPDHSSLTVIRKRLPLAIHEQVFALALGIAERKQLLKGKSLGVDSTLIEANAAMKSIVRKDTGDDWKEYLTQLAAEAGLENPTDEEPRRAGVRSKAQGQEGFQCGVGVAHGPRQPHRQDEGWPDASGLQDGVPARRETCRAT